MIDVHGHEAALVVVGIPEAELLAAVHDVGRVVDVERDLGGRRRKRGAELVDQGCRQPHRLPAARHVLQPAHGRLRAQLAAALRAAADRQLQERVLPQPVEIVAVLVAAADRQRAGLDQLDERMLDPGWITAIGQAGGEPRADAGCALGLAQQQEAAVRGLVAAIEIDCELLAADGWKIEGKQRSFGHGGVAPRFGREALVWQRIATRSQRPPPHPSTDFSSLVHRSG